MYTYTLPSGVEIELRGMTGDDEEILTNRKLMKDGAGINKVLANCIVRIGQDTEIKEDDVLNMLAGDRLFALVRLRQASYGDEIDMELRCTDPECDAVTGVHIDCEDLEVTAYSGDVYGSPSMFELPSSKLIVEFVYLDGTMEKRMAAMKPVELNIHTPMLMRIKSVDGKPPSKNTLRGLAVSDLKALRDAMTRLDGGIDTKVTARCIECGALLTTRLESNESFFFPGVR